MQNLSYQAICGYIMKKWILVLGVVMLLVGVSMYAYSGLEKPKISENSFIVKGNEYISRNVSVDSKSFIISVANPVTGSGLVPSKDISNISNQTALSAYSLPTYTSFGNIKEYRNLTEGNYAFIEFSSSHPATSITYGSTGYLVYIGYVADVSTFLILIGIIVAIAGIVLNNKFKLREF
jgi:general stress protein CsbA